MTSPATCKKWWSTKESEGVFGDEDEVKSVSVSEGESITLHAGLNETQSVELILWTFGPDSTRIAQINKMISKVSSYDDVLDGTFRDRLKLDYRTGDLTITNTRAEQSGLYELQIIGRKEVPSQKLSILVYYDSSESREDASEPEENKSLMKNGQISESARPFVEKDEIKSLLVMDGQSVILHTDVTEIQANELIRWKFADSKECCCAEFVDIATWDTTNDKEEIHLNNEERFKDRLKLDHNTGSLTITNITPKHYGHYKLHITSKGQKISKTFNVVAHVQMKRERKPTQRRQTCP